MHRCALYWNRSVYVVPIDDEYFKESSSIPPGVSIFYPFYGGYTFKWVVIEKNEFKCFLSYIQGCYGKPFLIKHF